MSADISSAIDNGEAIITSKATFEKAKEKLRLVDASNAGASPQALRSKEIITSFEFVDLLTAPGAKLVDIPGVDEDLAQEILKTRSGSSNLAEFLDRGGFHVLTEEIQYDVGLLGRNEMVLTFNGKPLDKKMLRELEVEVFGRGEGQKRS